MMAQSQVRIGQFQSKLEARAALRAMAIVFSGMEWIPETDSFLVDGNGKWALGAVLNQGRANWWVVMAEPIGTTEAF